LIGSRNLNKAEARKGYDDCSFYKQCQNVHVNILRCSRGVVRHTTIKNDNIDEEEKEMGEFIYQQRNQGIEILEIVSSLLKLIKRRW